MREEFLLTAIGLIDDDLIEEARETRRMPLPWKQWLAAAACLMLIVSAGLSLPKGGTKNDGASTGAMAGKTEAGMNNAASPPGNYDGGTADMERPEDTKTESGCGTMPGSIYQPVLWWQSEAYYWKRVETTQPSGNWTTIGELTGTTVDETRQEDLLLYADFDAAGTVYADEAFPNTLYVRMTTDWFEEYWVCFVQQS